MHLDDLQHLFNSRTGLHAFNARQLFYGHFYWLVLSASQRDEGRCDFRTVRDETSVEVDHTKDVLASGSRFGVFSYIAMFGRAPWSFNM